MGSSVGVLLLLLFFCLFCACWGRRKSTFDILGTPKTTQCSIKDRQSTFDEDNPLCVAKPSFDLSFVGADPPPKSDVSLLVGFSFSPSKGSSMMRGSSLQLAFWFAELLPAGNHSFMQLLPMRADLVLLPSPCIRYSKSNYLNQGREFPL